LLPRRQGSRPLPQGQRIFGLRDPAITKALASSRMGTVVAGSVADLMPAVKADGLEGLSAKLYRAPVAPRGPECSHGVTFRLVSPSGERLEPAADYFTLPRQSLRMENVLAPLNC
jgi:hypothetical protein